MFCNVAEKSLDILMDKRVLQASCFAIDNYMFVYFNITHGVVLVSKTALEMTFSASKERQLPKSAVAKPKHPPEKFQLEEHIVALESGIPNCLLHFSSQVGSQNLVGIQQQDPIALQRKRVKCPLPLLRPAAMVVELHYFCTESARYFD